MGMGIPVGQYQQPGMAQPYPPQQMQMQQPGMAQPYPQQMQMQNNQQVTNNVTVVTTTTQQGHDGKELAKSDTLNQMNRLRCCFCCNIRCGLITLTVFEFLGLLGALAMGATGATRINRYTGAAVADFIMALATFVTGIYIIVKFLKYLCNSG